MTYDVVVAGAGPVGLLVASELALRGVRVLVVERLTEPDLTIKAGSINVPTADGSRLADHLHSGAGVLILPAGADAGAGNPAPGRLEVVAGDGPAMLVRPDGIVAWVAGDGDLDEALRRWFGGVSVEAVAATV